MAAQNWCVYRSDVYWAELLANFITAIQIQATKDYDANLTVAMTKLNVFDRVFWHTLVNLCVLVLVTKAGN